MERASAHLTYRWKAACEGMLREAGKCNKVQVKWAFPELSPISLGNGRHRKFSLAARWRGMVGRGKTRGKKPRCSNQVTHDVHLV